MTMKQAIKIPFSEDTVNKCQCTVCPVQKQSQCVKLKINDVPFKMKVDPVDTSAIPNAYCSQGTASCKDIDAKQNCICGTCNVYKEYHLDNADPSGYYCRNGIAHVK